MENDGSKYMEAGDIVITAEIPLDFIAVINYDE